MAMSVMTNATPSVSDPVYPTAESTRDAGSGVLGDCRSRARHANERSSPKRKRTATIGERPDLLPPGPLAILGAGGYLMRRFRPAQTEPRLAVINAASVDGRRHTAGGAWRQCNDTIAVVPSRKNILQGLRCHDAEIVNPPIQTPKWPRFDPEGSGSPAPMAGTS